MVNNSGSVPPTGAGSNPTPPEPTDKKKAADGGFHTTKTHSFLGMTFQPKDWDKLMNLMVRNMSEYISRTFKKMNEELKKDWRRGEGKQAD